MTDDTVNTAETRLTRRFDAPVADVWAAFTDPVLLAQWFGPLTFHVPRDSVDVDLREGGHWRLTMVNNDDAEVRSPVDATFAEVLPEQLLVGYEVAQGFPGIPDGTRLTLTLEFRADGDGTILELRQGPFTEGLRDMNDIGWGQSFFKLDGLLATPARFRTAMVDLDG
jgi:uncharacterized protein YndB with AHSA1/START domain